MEQTGILITHPYALLAVLMLVPVFFLKLEQWTEWKVFEYLPPIIWIFLFPIVLSGFKVIPTSSPTYDTFKAFGVPMFIILMLLDVDIRSTMKVAFRSIGVLVMGSLGVVVGGVFSFWILKSQLDPEAWRAFGALAGSWIGGTGNLAAVAEMVDTPPSMLGMVVIADIFIFMIYFPLVFICKKWAKPFAEFTGVKEEEAAELEKAIDSLEEKSDKVHFRDVLTLFGIGFLLIWIIRSFSASLPEVGEILNAKTWEFLILTTVALFLASTPLRKVPGTKAMSMALVYVYMSMMGAMADISQAATAPYFLIAGVICMVTHVIFVVAGAKIFRVDVHLTAIASVASIGGAASSPVVAAYHRKELVAVAILLALFGYALGNYLGYLAAVLCRLVM
jgi:uncharacterized membrane protein